MKSIKQLVEERCRNKCQEQIFSTFEKQAWWTPYLILQGEIFSRMSVPITRSIELEVTRRIYQDDKKDLF